jgi:F-type H+-transporting ATPase subunit delta
MREETVARRYAAALLAQVRENDATLTTVQGDLQRVAQSLQDTPALGALLAQPLVTETRKKHVLAQAFGQDVQPVTLAFLNLLVDKRRANLLLAVQAEFERMVREVRNIAYATATSAVPLSAEQLIQLERALEARTGKDIELRTELDPDLIGGVLVRIGDTVLDGSVRGNLERLREQLLARH